MKVLIASEADVESQVFAPLAEELLRRGHEVDVYSRYRLDTFHIEYKLRGIPVKPLEDLNGHESEYDVALVYREVLKWLKRKDIPLVYLFFGPNSSEFRVEGNQLFLSDLVLVASENQKKYLRRAGHKGEIVVTGLPKHDDLFHMEKEQEKLIVVADSPSRPRGLQRQNYFNLILELARRMPDHQVLIKPRFLLGENWEGAPFLTGVDKHMEFYLKSADNPPPNLRVLNTYHSINALASRAELMVSGTTSAIFSQMLLGKPALVIQNTAKNRDLIHGALYRGNLSTYLPSGCCIWMDELLDHIPDGLIANKHWVEEEIGLFDGKSSARVADVLESVVKNSRASNFWVPYLNSTAHNFGEKFAAYRKHLDTLSAELQEKEHQEAIRRMAETALGTLEAILIDLVEELEMEQELRLYRKMIEKLLSLSISPDLLNRVVLIYFENLFKLTDKIWNLRKNYVFFRHEQNREIMHLSYFMGMALGEEDLRNTAIWEDFSREQFGYTMLDYMREGPYKKNADNNKNIAEMLFADGFNQQACCYADWCIKNGERNFTPPFLQFLLDDYKKDLSRETVQEIIQQLENITP